MKEIYIIGAGGFGREVAWLIERINSVNPTWQVVGFIDDNNGIISSEQDGYKVIGNCDYLIKESMSKEIYAICAIGSAKIRKKIIRKIKTSNVKFATLIDPSVIMSNRVTIGQGSIICAGTIITVDVQIGDHVIVNLDCTIGHDDIINDFVTIYPSVNVSGMVKIGSCVELGTGVQIIQSKEICDETVIGAGAVIVKDIDCSGTYIGVPAKRI